MHSYIDTFATLTNSSNRAYVRLCFEKCTCKSKLKPWTTVKCSPTYGSQYGMIVHLDRKCPRCSEYDMYGGEVERAIRSRLAIEAFAFPGGKVEGSFAWRGARKILKIYRERHHVAYKGADEGDVDEGAVESLQQDFALRVIAPP